MTVHELIRSKTPKWYIVLFRVFMGGFYLHVALNLLLAVQADGAFLKNRLVALESQPQFAWFQSWLQAVVDPVRDSAFLPALLIAAPALLGVSLVIGLFARAGALLGAILVANVYLLQYSSATETHRMSLELQFAALMLLFFAAAGRSFGVDAVFWKNRVLAKYVSSPDDGLGRSERPLPVIRDLPPIPLSENKPGTKPPPKAEDKHE